MRVLAIDPGTTTSALVIWDNSRKRIEQFGKHDNVEFLELLRTKQLSADHCAMEMIASYGMAVGAEVFETCVWIGKFLEAWNRESTMIYRRNVKLHICGSPRAKDANIRAALIDLVGPQGTKRDPGPTFGISGDVWSALAVAITYCDHR